MQIDQIILGDCLEIMKEIPDQSADLVFADPPFNVGKKYGSNRNNDKRDDYYEWCKLWIKECFRILKDTGTFYLMTIDRHLENMFMLMSEGVFINLVKWKNTASSNSKRSFWKTTQPILVYGKSTNYKFNTYAQEMPVSKPSWNRDRRKRARNQMRDYWDDIKNVYSGSVCHPEVILVGDGSKRKAHPCQMPISLPERAILFSTDVGDIVVDPFIGVGATAIACIRTGRHYIGIEKEKKYFDITMNRIEDEN